MIRTLVAAALVLSAGSLQLPRGRLAADQALPVPEIEKIVRDYLMREPEVIYEAIQELQKRQQAAEAARQQTSIVERADEIFRHPEDPIAGDAVGRRHPGRVLRLSLRLLPHGWWAICARWSTPTPSSASCSRSCRCSGRIRSTAAKAALAASKLDHDKYYDFHLALMQTKDLSRDTVLARSRSPRATTRDAIAAEMEAAWVQERLDANHALAESLGINGTPSFVVGKTLIPGAVEIGRLAQLVQDERKASN